MPTRYWPLARGHTITSAFGWQDWRKAVHWGIDFGHPKGSGGLPVYASQGGTVQYAGPAAGFGSWVVIDHPTDDGGGTTVYGHIIPAAKVGQRVEAGQLIAHIHPTKSAANGNADPHLHFEWHRYSYTEPRNTDDVLNPMPLLAAATYPGETPAIAKPTPPPVQEKPMGESILGIPFGKYAGWRGDPTWLADVLRAANLPVIEHEGWRQRGHGDFGLILGILCHHTAGGGKNDWRIVQDGRPGLAGPLAQLVLEKDGTYRVIAVGVCWHAGRGSWPGWPTNNANFNTIGIEAVSRGTAPWDWTEIQLQNYRIGCAAIMNAIGRRAA